MILGREIWLLSFCAVLLIAHQIAERILEYPIPFADNYLDAFLLMPVLLTLWRWEHIFLWKRERDFQLSNMHLIAAVIFAFLVAEILFPILTTNFTYDIYDFVAYIAGALT